MTTRHYFCCDDRRRRNEIAQRDDLNGIDFLEVLDDPALPDDQRQRTLFVHFINDAGGLVIAPENVVIEGGERIRDVRVVAAQVDGSPAPVLTVEVDAPGDFSTYTLRLVSLPRLDPVLSAVDFSFKVNCRTEFDPLQEARCEVEPEAEPALDYLARDYPSLRQLVLDRLSVLVPDWQERNAADMGVALVELMAYLGDQLSYWQDAVATEAYLGTCRLRTSARRHARLVDYAMHDGCNARAWIHIPVPEGTGPFELRAARFYTAIPDLPRTIIDGSREAERAAISGATAFELMAPVLLAPEHNRIRFHTWGARECCLPKGAVSATLRGELPELAEGMVLVFEEVRGPQTGDPDDADLARRHAVRLTAVTHTSDPVGRRFDPEPSDDPLPVTEIRWAADDALPWPLCISARLGDGEESAFVDDVSVARGNIALADHGARVSEALGRVPGATVERVRPEPADGCRHDRVELAPVRFRPRLSHGPLTQAASLATGSARAAMRFPPATAVPQITIADGTGADWAPRIDLIGSGETKRFVVEVEADGRGRVRFGDGVHGLEPIEGTNMTATYRVGNGAAGNVGADTLVHVVSDERSLGDVRNPLAATGGVEMETIEEVRQYAPVAFRPQTLPGRPDRPDGRTLARAVTPADYAAVTEVHSAVQRAAARFRWTGSWHTASVAVDPFGGGALTAELEDDLRAHLEPYRLAGHDLEIEPPRAIALEIAITVRVKPGFFATHVRSALLDALAERFHPDNLTFGQTVHLSPLYAAAQAVEGVESVDVTTFQRRDRPGREGIDEGRIVLGRREIARLDNDPNFPERGVLTVRMEGGR